MKIFVFSENLDLGAELIGLAKTVNAEAAVSAFAIGGDAEAKYEALCSGKVYTLGEQSDKVIDDYIPAMAKVVAEEQPELVLVGATVIGRIVAAKLSAAAGTCAIVNAKTISNDGKLAATHLIYGGGAVRVDSAKGATMVATVGHGSAEAAQPTGGAAEVVAVELVEPKVKIKKLSATANKKGGSDILTAKKVIGCGRGFFTKEDLQYAKDFADAIGATLGYSRPVTELDPPIAEGEPYIGVSGIYIKPDLYIAVAISGQTQHMIAVNDSKVVVGINTDIECQIGQLCDYLIKGDYKEILPALTKAVQG